MAEWGTYFPNWMYQSCHYLNKLPDIWKRPPSPTHSSVGTTAHCHCAETPRFSACAWNHCAVASGWAALLWSRPPRWVAPGPQPQSLPAGGLAQPPPCPGQHDVQASTTRSSEATGCPPSKPVPSSSEEMPIRQPRHSQCQNTTAIPD